MRNRDQFWTHSKMTQINTSGRYVNQLGAVIDGNKKNHCEPMSDISEIPLELNQMDSEMNLNRAVWAGFLQG